MMKYEAKDLNYKGESCGVHNWITDEGHSFYWHPDWVHIAEDQTGIHPKEKLDVKDNEKGTRAHAISAIIKHLNNWIVDEIEKHPEVKDQAQLYDKDS
ncbi:hypothetical protein JCM19237_6509 [Photobacterium aphoticum]|uniref:Uncharacterized protein n=1 Tax=Photobacterium aphoticum TaxID=754436 RepID=A0A090QKE8_9GAMM|nr:hypothetical protein JCM19237_6509 [Photobacterium aphoticum]